MDDRDLLARVIDASGLTRSQYAKRVLLREPRTIRRWMDGDSPIPRVVAEYLHRIAPPVAVREDTEVAVQSDIAILRAWREDSALFVRDNMAAHLALGAAFDLAVEGPS